MSLIHPRNPRRCRGFKTVFEELAGHRETGLQEGKTSGQNVEGSEEIRMVVGGGHGGKKIHLMRQEEQSCVVRKGKNNEEGIHVRSTQILVRLRSF